MKLKLVVAAAFLAGLLLLGLHLSHPLRVRAQDDQLGSESPHFTGEMMLAKCAKGLTYKESPALTERDVRDILYCSGYVRGFMDGVDVGQTAMLSHSHAGAARTSCAPDVSTGQGMRVFLKYLGDHPERLHEPAYILMWAALSQAWPCNSK